MRFLSSCCCSATDICMCMPSPPASPQFHPAHAVRDLPGGRYSSVETVSPRMTQAGLPVSNRCSLPMLMKERTTFCLGKTCSWYPKECAGHVAGLSP